MLSVCFVRRRGSKGVFHPQVRGPRDDGAFVSGVICGHKVPGNCEELDTVWPASIRDGYCRDYGKRMRVRLCQEGAAELLDQVRTVGTTLASAAQVAKSMEALE